MEWISTPVTDFHMPALRAGGLRRCRGATDMAILTDRCWRPFRILCQPHFWHAQLAKNQVFASLRPRAKYTLLNGLVFRLRKGHPTIKQLAVLQSAAG